MTLLKAALNGGTVATAVHRVPVTAEQLAADTASAQRAGADVVHLHARRADGGQSIAAHDLAAVLTAVRAAAPQVSIGTTTGLWCADGPQDRYEQVASWTVLPDFASVAFSEEGAAETAELVVARGMVLESAVWSVDDIPALRAARRSLDANVRVLIEPMDADPAQAVAHAREMAAELRAAGVTCPLLYHGEGPTAWPVLMAALQDGHQIRIGFEDATTLPDGRPAATNTQLVAAARRLADLHGR